jgi:hypothetical protein
LIPDPVRIRIRNPEINPLLFLSPENLLTNNLIRRKDELVQALQEISVEDRHQQLENAINDLKVTTSLNIKRQSCGSRFI